MTWPATIGVVLLLIAVDLWFSLPNLAVADRALFDTDGYMRIVRVDELRTGAVSWFDSWAPRSNAPFGHSMHWTRPLDALILGVSAVVGLFTGAGDTLYWSALAVTSILFGVLGVLVGWAAQPLVGSRWPLASLAVIVQPAVMQYSAVGRVDHHLLVLVAFVALVGSLVRVLTEDLDRATWAMVAGVMAAAGLWVSTEFLLPVALVLVLGAGLWAWSDLHIGAAMQRFAVALAAGVGLALVAERGVDLAPVEFDRLSWPHLLIAVLAWMAWVVLDRVPVVGILRRTVTAGVAGLAAAAVVWALVPDFFAGPFGQVPEALWDAWLGSVVELRPLWPLGPDPARTLLLLGGPAIGFAVAVAALWTDRRTAWWPVAACLGVMTAVGFAQLRFSALAEVLAPIPLAWLAAQLLDRVGDRESWGASLTRVGALGSPFTLFLLPVVLAAVLPQGSDGGGATSGADCNAREVVEAIESEGLVRPVVAANVDLGPEILYRTDASVLASPYHRNIDGILDARRLLLAPAGEASTIVRDRGIDLLVLCPDRDQGYLGGTAIGPDAMFELLVFGVPPPWAQPVATAGDDRGFLLFRLDP